MIRQFTEQRRLNAAFSHDLRTPLTILKGHTTMLLSFIPKGLVSQQEVLDELSTVRNNVERLEKYVSAMTNLYRLEVQLLGTAIARATSTPDGLAPP